MKTRLHSCVVLSGLVMITAGGAVADSPPPPQRKGGFYEETNQGWFWKEKIPEPGPPAEPEELPQPVPLTGSTPVEAEVIEDVSSEPEKTESPRPFSPAWLREKLPEYRDRALADPSPANVRNYFYVQRYSMDMAERFALVAQKVVLADPVLDENNRRPLSDYGAQIFDERARAATEQIAKKLAGESGLWYFYSSECPYCAAQEPILKNLERKLDLAVLPIALDGRAMPDTQFEKFVPNKGHAEQLQVRVTPTIYMVKPPNDFVLISEGVVTENSLKQRMILGAHEAGWITDAELNATKPVNPIQIQADLGELPENVLNDPERLVEILRSKIVQ